MAVGTGNALRRMRLETGVSIRSLETRTGINRGRLSVIERGLEPTADELRRIVSALSPGSMGEAHDVPKQSGR